MACSPQAPTTMLNLRHRARSQSRTTIREPASTNESFNFLPLISWRAPCSTMASLVASRTVTDSVRLRGTAFAGRDAATPSSWIARYRGKHIGKLHPNRLALKLCCIDLVATSPYLCKLVFVLLLARQELLHANAPRVHLATKENPIRASENQF